jgi:hypothetical protein
MRWTSEQYAEWQRKRAAGVGAVGGSKREQNTAPALEKDAPAEHSRQAGVEYRVSIISCRYRIQDDDNSEAGNKALRDAIAEWLRIDDGDKRIRFIYGQVLAGHDEGTIVKIERLSRYSA